MSEPPDPRRATRLEEISAAAERARRQLREEVSELRAGIERMHAEKSDDAPKQTRSAAPAVARTGGASAALIGLIGAIGLAIPGTIAVREGVPLFGGGPLPGATARHGSTSRASIAAGESAVSGGPTEVAAATSVVGGPAPANGGSATSRLVVRTSSPVQSGGAPPPAGGGPITQQPVAPAPAAEGVPAASTPPAEAGSNDSPQAKPASTPDGEGQSGGPVTSATAGAEDSPGHGHGRGGGPESHGPPHSVPPTTSPPPWAAAPSAGDEADDPGSSGNDGPAWSPHGRGPGANGRGRATAPGRSGR